MNRKQMYDKIIKELGHEHKATIWFISFAEEHPTAEDIKLENVLTALLDLVHYATELQNREQE